MTASWWARAILRLYPFLDLERQRLLRAGWRARSSQLLRLALDLVPAAWRLRVIERNQKARTEEPSPEPERIVKVQSGLARRARHGVVISEVRGATRRESRLLAGRRLRSLDRKLSGEGDPERLEGEMVTASNSTCSAYCPQLAVQCGSDGGRPHRAAGGKPTTVVGIVPDFRV
jgi:hypothetical protein